MIRQGGRFDKSNPYFSRTLSGHNELDKIAHKSHLLIVGAVVKMRVKILVLGLICFVIFAYCNSPADPEIEEVLKLPSIDYFTARHNHSIAQDGRWNSYFTLSWSVINAMSVSIDQGIGEVSAEGTIGVQISERTAYTLTATNKNGKKTASCWIEPPCSPPSL